MNRNIQEIHDAIKAMDDGMAVSVDDIELEMIEQIRYDVRTAHNRREPAGKKWVAWLSPSRTDGKRMVPPLYGRGDMECWAAPGNCSLV